MLAMMQASVYGLGCAKNEELIISNPQNSVCRGCYCPYFIEEEEHAASWLKVWALVSAP